MTPCGGGVLAVCVGRDVPRILESLFSSSMTCFPPRMRGVAKVMSRVALQDPLLPRGRPVHCRTTVVSAAIPVKFLRPARAENDPENSI